MREIYDGLKVCIDCTMFIANGEVFDGTGDITAEHAAIMEREWANADALLRDLVLACPENCEGEFSWHACDGCGSTLAGDRHPAVALGPEESL